MLSKRPKSITHLKVVILRDEIVEKIKSLRTFQWSKLVDELRMMADSENCFPTGDWISTNSRVHSSQALIDIKR